MGKEFYSRCHIADQQVEYLAGYAPDKELDIFEDAFISGIRGIFKFMHQKKIQMKDVQWDSLRLEVRKNFQFLSTEVIFKVSLVDSTLHLQEAANEATVFGGMHKSYTPQPPTLKQEELAELKQAFMKAMGETILAPPSIHSTPPKDPEPKPLTYLDLKEKALKEGKLAMPPVDKDETDLI